MELEKIIAEAVGVRGRRSKAVERHYWDLINKFGGELALLLDADDKELGRAVPSNIAGSHSPRPRGQKLNISPGYDGAYGVIKIFKDDEVIEGRKKTNNRCYFNKQKLPKNYGEFLKPLIFFLPPFFLAVFFAAFFLAAMCITSFSF